MTGGTGFNNPILQGIILARTAIRSDNYIAGTSGWTINRDGTAEFVGAVVAGSLRAHDPTLTYEDVYIHDGEIDFEPTGPGFNIGNIHGYNDNIILINFPDATTGYLGRCYFVGDDGVGTGPIFEVDAENVVFDNPGGVNPPDCTVTANGGVMVFAGEIRAYAGAAAPAGWLLCDGTSYATATYPALFNAIGYTYGGAGANFNVPDARGRNLVHPDGGAIYTALGTTGGATNHTHPLSANGQARITVSAATPGLWQQRVAAANWNSTHSLPTTPGGGGVSSQPVGTALQGATDSTMTVDPFVCVNHIIRAVA